ncbi:hypothetical protein SAMN05216252_104186 [Actinacidiphila glaucinigra]|uniref:Uncharacterized protein n=1 Tax=Actinacidiphila glaucinigra TaxID=235986 RepID=A0A239CTR0_9ACTN|nr:hypothetical protein SAMN05216252_104186 [Actinacidiphila glaucinigra]
MLIGSPRPAPRFTYNWPSGYAARSRCASRLANVDLPTPGGPAIATTRAPPAIAARSAASSASLPVKSATSGGSCAGVRRGAGSVATAVEGAAGSCRRCCHRASPAAATAPAPTAGQAQTANGRSAGGRTPPVATFTATARATDTTPDASARSASTQPRRTAPPPRPPSPGPAQDPANPTPRGSAQPHGSGGRPGTGTRRGAWSPPVDAGPAAGSAGARRRGRTPEVPVASRVCGPVDARTYRRPASPGRPRPRPGVCRGSTRARSPGPSSCPGAAAGRGGAARPRVLYGPSCRVAGRHRLHDAGQVLGRAPGRVGGLRTPGAPRAADGRAWAGRRRRQTRHPGFLRAHAGCPCRRTGRGRGTPAWGLAAEPRSRRHSLWSTWAIVRRAARRAGRYAPRTAMAMPVRARAVRAAGCQTSVMYGGRVMSTASTMRGTTCL